MPAKLISRDQSSVGGRRTGDERDLALAVLLRGGQSTTDRGERGSDIFDLSGHGGGERERAEWGERGQEAGMAILNSPVILER